VQKLAIEAIPNSEVDRIGALKQLRHSRLVKVRKDRDRPFVVAKCTKSPSLCAKVPERDAAIILNDDLAVIE
jgi:hypothetical protein